MWNSNRKTVIISLKRPESRTPHCTHCCIRRSPNKKIKSPWNLVSPLRARASWLHCVVRPSDRPNLLHHRHHPVPRHSGMPPPPSPTTPIPAASLSPAERRNLHVRYAAGRPTDCSTTGPDRRRLALHFQTPCMCLPSAVAPPSPTAPPGSPRPGQAARRWGGVAGQVQARRRCN